MPKDICSENKKTKEKPGFFLQIFIQQMATIQPKTLWQQGPHRLQLIKHHCISIITLFLFALGRNSNIEGIFPTFTNEAFQHFLLYLSRSDGKRRSGSRNKTLLRSKFSAEIFSPVPRRGCQKTPSPCFKAGQCFRKLVNTPRKRCSTQLTTKRKLSGSTNSLGFPFEPNFQLTEGILLFSFVFLPNGSTCLKQCKKKKSQ